MCYVGAGTYLTHSLIDISFFNYFFCVKGEFTVYILLLFAGMYHGGGFFFE